MRYAIVLLFILSIPAIGFSATINIPADYPTIQQGINAAVNGDIVLVAPGTYLENIDFKGKAIMVTSEQGANFTVIDGNQAGSVVTCQSGEGVDSVLDGFTITNGFATNGGGMYNLKSCPTVTSCTFSKNMGQSSGGMGNEDGSNSTVTNCTFSGNHGGVPGSSSGVGGMGNSGSDPMVTNCTFSGNSGKFSGGMCNLDSDPMVTNCTFSGNSGNGTSFFSGGGMLNEGSSPTVINCTFSGNSACIGGYGGGMGNYYSSPMVMNCTFSGNSATYWGGGILNYHSSPTVTNSILWNNDAFTGPEIWIGDKNYPSTLTISNSDVKGGKASVYVDPGCTLNWGSGMIDSDPLFVDPTNGDFHLTFPSPCKDTGDNTAVTEPTDFEGDPRIAYGTVDMGADEFYTHLYWTGDATPGGNVEMKFVGLPGTTPVQLWLGSGVMDPPMTTKYGEWYLQFPLLAEVGLGSIPSDGVLAFPFTFPANTPTPLTLPFQSGIGMELSNLSVMEVE